MWLQWRLFSPLSGTMYSSTKAFEVMFSENLQSELYDTGLKIQALCPGLTHTEFHQVAGIRAMRPFQEYLDESR